MSDQTVSNQTAPNQTVSNQTVSNQTAPNQTVSNWQKASTFAQCTQVIVVTFSLIFISLQVRQQKSQLAQQTRQVEQQLKLSRASNTQSLVDLLTPLNLKVTDPEMAQLWVKGEDEINKEVDPVKRKVWLEQYQTLVASYMVFYENAYSQYCADLLDADIYQGWDKDLAEFIKGHNIGKHWDEWKPSYRPDFGNHVTEIINTQQSFVPTRPCQ